MEPYFPHAPGRGINNAPANTQETSQPADLSGPRTLGFFSAVESLWNGAKAIAAAAVESVADKVSNLLKGASGQWGYDNDIGQDPIIQYNGNKINFWHGRLVCLNCYARVSGTVKAHVHFSWATLKDLEFSVSAGAKANVNIQVNHGDPYTHQDDDTAPITQPAMVRSFTFMIGLVPLWIDLLYGVDMTASWKSSTRAYIKGPGFYFDYYLALGIKYTQSQGWQPIHQTASTLQTNPGQYDLTVDARATLGGMPYARFSFYSAFPIDIILKPVFEATKALSVSQGNTCGANSFKLTSTGSLMLAIRANKPQLSIADLSFSPDFGGNWPKSWDLPIVNRYNFNVRGTAECLGSKSSAAHRILEVSYSTSQQEASQHMLRGIRSLGVSADVNETCGPSLCAFAVSAWTACDVDCGLGLQYRSVTCRTEGGAAAPVDNSFCTAYGLSVPSSTQQCAAACGTVFPFSTSTPAAGYFKGNGTRVLLGSRRYDFGQWLSYSGFYAYDLVLSGDNAIYAGVVPTFGDPDVYILWPTGPAGTQKSSRFFNTANDSVFVLPEDGVKDRDTISMFVFSYSPSWPSNLTYTNTIALSRPGYAAYRLTVVPFTELIAGKRVSASTPNAAAQPVRYYRFVPVVGARSFCVHVWSKTTAAPILYASIWNVDGWPSASRFQWASSTDPTDTSRFMCIDETEYTHGIYAFAASCPAALGACNFTIHAANVMLLGSGDLVLGTNLPDGVAFYTLPLAATDNIALVVLDSVAGDADLFVSRSPFAVLPGAFAYDCTTPGAVWCSTNPGIVDSQPGSDKVLITSLDPQWGNMLFIAVIAWPKSFTAEFALSAQSYEQLDNAVVYHRYQQPSAMTYFLGNNWVGGDEEIDRTLHINARATGTQGTVTILAGSVDRFYPAVQEGFQGAFIGPLRPSEAGYIVTDYLDGSYISRQMIIGVSTGPALQTGAAARQLSRHGGDADRHNTSADLRHRTPGTISIETLNLFESWKQYLGAEDMSDLSSAIGQRAWSPLRFGTTPSQAAGFDGGAIHRTDSALAKLDAAHGIIDGDISTRGEWLPSAVEDKSLQAASADAAPAISTQPAAWPTVATNIHAAPRQPIEASAAVARRLRSTRQRMLSRSVAHQLQTQGRRVSGLDAAFVDLSSMLLGTTPSAIIIPMSRFAAHSWPLIANCTTGSVGGSNDACGAVDMPVSHSRVLPLFLRFRIPAMTSALVLLSSSAVGASVFPHESSLSMSQPPSVLDMDPADNISPQQSVDTGAETSHLVTNCKFVPDYAFAVVTPLTLALPQPAAPTRISVRISATAADRLLCPKFTWYAGEWTACDTSCGAGTQSRVVACTDPDLNNVDEGLCPTDTRPSAHQICEAGECLWSLSDWGTCSVSCGGGIQRRTVTCRNMNGTGVVVVDSKCNAASPPTQQPCNTAACTNVYWSVGAWNGCSVKCGGGVMSRTATCMSASSRAPTALHYCQILGPAPETSALCNTAPCPAVTFDLAVFDSRRLREGVPLATTLVPGAAEAFTFQRPSAASRGLCLRASTSPALPGTCSSLARSKLSLCHSQFQYCMDLESRAAANISSPGVMEAFMTWNRRLKGTYAVPSSACACFSSALSCIQQAACSQSDYKSTIGSFISLCNATTVCSSRGACTAPPALPQLDVVVPAVPGAVPAVEIFARPWSPDPVQQAFNPPTDLDGAAWTNALGLINTRSNGAFSLAIFDDLSASSDSDFVMIGVRSPNASVLVNISVTSLTAFPFTLSGTLLQGATASDIRAGGRTLTITSNCDSFVPADMLVPVAPDLQRIVADPARTIAGPLSGNFIAGGLLADFSLYGGWNTVVRTVLLANNTASFVRLSADAMSITIELPPVPAYNPSRTERLHVVLPPAATFSGLPRVIPDVVITIESDDDDCELSPWSEWSFCDPACGQGSQRRYRTVVKLPRGQGAACPELNQTRPCHDCDPCSTSLCLYSGVCISGECACPPGYTGVDCSVPPPASSVPFYAVGPWSACDMACGNGIQRRTSQCMLLTNGEFASTAQAICELAGVDRPNATRTCNLGPCARPNVQLSLLVPSTADASLVITGTASHLEAFERALTKEMSEILRVPSSAVIVSTVNRALVTKPDDTSNLKSVVELLSAYDDSGFRLADESTATLRRLQTASDNSTAALHVNVSVIPGDATSVASVMAILGLASASNGSLAMRGTFLRVATWNLSDASVVIVSSSPTSTPSITPTSSATFIAASSSPTPTSTPTTTRSPSSSSSYSTTPSTSSAQTVVPAELHSGIIASTSTFAISSSVLIIVGVVGALLLLCIVALAIALRRKRPNASSTVPKAGNDTFSDSNPMPSAILRAQNAKVHSGQQPQI